MPEIEKLVFDLLKGLQGGGVPILKSVIFSDEAVELVKRIITMSSDPSTVTIDEIREEREKMKSSSHYWD